MSLPSADHSGYHAPFSLVTCDSVDVAMSYTQILASSRPPITTATRRPSGDNLGVWYDRSSGTSDRVFPVGSTDTSCDRPLPATYARVPLRDSAAVIAPPSHF